MGFIEFGLADAPILTEAAAEIAPRRAEAQDSSAGKKMVQGLLLDRINREAGRSSITKRIKLASDILADITEACLPIAHTAKARAERAKDPPVFFGPPPKCFFHTANIPLLMPRSKRNMNHFADCISFTLWYSASHEPNRGNQRNAPHRA